VEDDDLIELAETPARRSETLSERIRLQDRMAIKANRTGDDLDTRMLKPPRLTKGKQPELKVENNQWLTESG
jgi:hypothetical protein